MAKGRRGVSADQEEKLYSFILECLLLGETFAQIKEKVQRRAPTLSHATVSRWIENVVDAIAVTKKDANEGRAFRLGLAEQRLHDLYERCVKKDDIKTALSVLQQYIRLWGLELKKPSSSAVQLITNGPTMVRTDGGNVTAIQQQDDEEPQDKPKSPEELKKLLGVSEQEIIDQEDEDDTAGVGEGDSSGGPGDGRGEASPEVSEAQPPEMG